MHMIQRNNIEVKLDLNGHVGHRMAGGPGQLSLWGTTEDTQMVIFRASHDLLGPKRLSGLMYGSV